MIIRDNQFRIFLKRVAERVKVALFVTLLFFSPTAAFADFPEEQPSSRGASMGYSGVPLADGWSLFYNQAGLSYQENWWVGVHHENRYFSPELNFSSIGAIMPVKRGAFGLSVKRLGFSKFSQSKFGLAYGMAILPTLSAGIQLNAHHVYIAGEYGSALALTAEGGLMYNPTPAIRVSFHIINPTRTKLHEEERVPTQLRLGVAYQISPTVLVVGQVSKRIDADFSFGAGLEFELVKNLCLRAGMASKPSLISLGLGYRVASLNIDFAFTRHEVLGYTPHFSMSYLLGSKSRQVAPETQ